MFEIFKELIGNPTKYSADKLPNMLKLQFGIPKKVHIRAWLKYKRKYDSLELRSSNSVVLASLGYE